MKDQRKCNAMQLFCPTISKKHKLKVAKSRVGQMRVSRVVHSVVQSGAMRQRSENLWTTLSVCHVTAVWCLEWGWIGKLNLQE